MKKLLFKSTRMDMNCHRFVTASHSFAASASVTHLVSFFAVIFAASTGFGQLSGPKSIPGDYITISAAISDLNANGVGSGGVSFNVAAGHSETAANLVIAIAANPPTAANPIVFQKSGVGANPLITAAAGTSASLDGIIKLSGTDYITFDAIDLLDPPTNTGDAMMEWGYALLRASATDGCQNVVIKNCVITLQKINVPSSSVFSIGIYVANRNLAGTTVNWTDSSGQNRRNKFFGNTISNVYRGIQVISSSTARDENNEVGVVGEAPNSITNFGGSNQTTDAIRCEGQWNVKIRNNIINGGAGTTTFVSGIIATLFGSAPNVSNYEISYNTVTITSSSTSNLQYGIRALANGDTVNIHHNIVENCNIAATSASFNGIVHDPVGTTTAAYIHNNVVRNNTLSGTGTMNLLAGMATSTANINNLAIYSNTIHGNQKTGVSGILYGIQTANGSIKCYSNAVYNNSIPASSGTGAASVYGYYNNSSTAVAETVYNNSIYALSVDGTSTSTSSVVYGIYSTAGTSSNAAAKNIYGNTIYGLSSSVGTVGGIFQQYGSTIRIHKNSIYNLSTGTANTTNYAAGIVIAGSLTGAGPVTTVYNNFISDLRAPTSINPNGVIGINSTLSAASTSVAAYYNTIYLDAASSGANFGSSGISSVGSATATTASLDLRNNIIVNVSTPNGTGLSTVLRRTNANLANYSANSNNNCLYAGTPSASHLIFYDGTNNDQTLTDYQARVSPRDAASISVMPPFVNATTTPYNLHIDTTVNSPVESGGTLISSITTDIDGDLRFGAPGYGGTGTAPDVGADEFEGIPLIPMVYVSSTTTQNTNAVFANSTNNHILGIEIVTSGFSAPLTVTGFTLNTNGSTNAVTDISNARVFYTGTSGTFGTTVLFGAYASPPPVPTTYTITGSQVLVSETNYFWVTYDIPMTATGGNVVDGEVLSITIDATPRVPSVTSPAGNRSIIASISGSYTISPTQPYPFNSFNNVAALLGSAGVAGPVVFNVQPGSGPYNEQVEFTAIPGAGATNTVTINGNSETLTFAPTATNRYLIRLNGTQRMTINDLRIMGTDPTYGYGIHLLNQANYNTISNCTIDLTSMTSTIEANSIGIVSSASTTSVTTAGNNANYCVFSGNTIMGGTGGGPWRGIRLNGNTGGVNGTANRIVNNIIRDFYAEGITLSNTDSTLVIGNDINRGTRVDVTIFQGVTLLSGCQNVRIERNRIHNTNGNATSQSTAAYGIYFNSVDAPVGSENVAVNNMLYNFNSVTGTVYGIYNTGSDGAHCFFNSISLDHAGSTAGGTRGFYQTTAAANVDFRNNIISIKRGGTGTKHCLYFGTSGSSITSNFNLVYINAPAGTNYVGFLNSNYATLTDWQTTGHDGNSVTGDPRFVSFDDLHITPEATPPSPANNAGTPIAGITVDFDGDTRHLTTPDIGADEFEPTVGVEKPKELPVSFALEQNYPNPFNPSTVIRYTLPVTSYITLKVYNILGQEVATLVNGEQTAGYHTVEWNGKNDQGASTASGIYFYKLMAGEFVQVRKMLLLK